MENVTKRYTDFEIEIKLQAIVNGCEPYHAYWHARDIAHQLLSVSKMTQKDAVQSNENQV